MTASTTGRPCAMAPERAAVTTAGPARERGTALVLVPAMVLVLLCLAAIAIDMSLVHAVHRDAHRVASVAADDAAAMIDERQLQVSGDLVIDPERAEQVVRAHVASVRLAGELVDVEVRPRATTVDVQLTVDAPHVVLPSFPGRDDSTRLVVIGRGRLHA
jgi:Flp pilus assembly protein TadG